MKHEYNERIRVYIEKGRRKAFAGAIDWPGWGRIGADERSALQALFDVSPRYAAALQAAGLDAPTPQEVSDLIVFERLEGNATTDFGSPNIPPSADLRLVEQEDYLHLQAIMMASWQAFDAALIAAAGRELLPGPRGSLRDVNAIVQHVISSDASDLAHLGHTYVPRHPSDPLEDLGPLRQAALNALARISLVGLTPRGGLAVELWSSRRYVRNIVWHTLDHVWEIEDRLSEA